MKGLAIVLGTLSVFVFGSAVIAQNVEPPPEGTVGIVTYQIQNGQAVQIGEVQVVLPLEGAVCLPDDAA